MTNQLTKTLTAASLLLLAACGHSSTTAVGQARVMVSLPTTAIASDIQRMVVQVYGGPIVTPVVQTLTKDAAQNRWTGVISALPPTAAGQFETFLVTAYDSAGNRIYQGSGDSPIVAGVQASVFIILQELSPTPGFNGSAPTINFITASSATVNALGNIVLHADVSDPNHLPLSLAWTASAGSFSAPTLADTSYIAPLAPGVVTLTLTVTQVGPTPPLSTSESFPITVNATAAGDTTVVVTLNQTPVVTLITVSNSRPHGDDTITLTATATDADNDTIKINWFNNYGNGGPCGTFAVADTLTDGTVQGKTVHFTIPHAAQTLDCVFYAYAYDFDSSGNPRVHDAAGNNIENPGVGTITIRVGAPLQPEYTPVIDLASQNLTEQFLGDEVHLSVNAHLVNDTSLNTQQYILYQNWRTNSGTIAITRNFNEASWFPGGCTGTPATASVDVIDARNWLTTTQSFTVNTCAPHSCTEVRNNHPEFAVGEGTGPYVIDPDGLGNNPPFTVYCDFSSFGGAWAAVANFTVPFRMTATFSLQDRSPFLADPHNYVSPSPGGTYSGQPEDHYDLRLFDSYGSTHSFYLQTLAQSIGYSQYTFYRAKASACPLHTTCLPSAAGANWVTGNVNNRYELLNFGTNTLYDANNPNWSPHVFSSWLSVPAWENAGGLNVLFGYRSTPNGCAVGGRCSCVTPQGDTQECFQTAGALVSGQNATTLANTDMGEPPQFALPSTLGPQPVVLWIRDDVPASIRR